MHAQRHNAVVHTERRCGEHVYCVPCTHNNTQLHIDNNTMHALQTAEITHGNDTAGILLVAELPVPAK